MPSFKHVTVEIWPFNALWNQPSTVIKSVWFCSYKPTYTTRSNRCLSSNAGHIFLEGEGGLSKKISFCYKPEFGKSELIKLRFVLLKPLIARIKYNSSAVERFVERAGEYNSNLVTHMVGLVIYWAVSHICMQQGFNAAGCFHRDNVPAGQP